MHRVSADQNLVPLRSIRSAPVVFGAGAAIGVLGGMIGLGGAEFRLPLLIGLFGFAALSAVILNKAMSLVVVLVALPARLAAVPAAEVAARWPVAVNLLAGSLLGAWAGASWAVRMRTASLSLLVSLPTMLVAFARYSRDGSFAVLGANLRFTMVMAAGSVAGAVLGGLLLGVFPDAVLIPALALILLASAVKLARHE
ncbi:TSUP family transporter [Streptomyces sp. NPDC056264]|uniref:TSUP family transporter n=1 Tax=Streptomyces sp. NPDC056264 TaxID=3345767 RepID=UPI003AACF93A